MSKSLVKKILDFRKLSRWKIPSALFIVPFLFSLVWAIFGQCYIQFFFILAIYSFAISFLAITAGVCFVEEVVNNIKGERSDE